MNTSNILARILAAAMLVGILPLIAHAGGNWQLGGASGGPYYAITGSNLSGASTIYFSTNITNSNPQVNTFYAKLFVNSQQVNSTTVSSRPGRTNVQLAYTFPNQGSYSSYTSVTDNQGETQDTSTIQIDAVPGLTMSVSPTSSSPQQGQSDSIKVSFVDNFPLLDYSTGSSSHTFNYWVVQTAPNGQTSTVVQSSTTSSYGLGSTFDGSFQIPLPTFSQGGGYSYAVYLTSPSEGTNATETMQLYVTPVSTTTTPTTTSTTSTVSTTSTISSTTSTIPTSTTTSTTSTSTSVPSTSSSFVTTSTIPSGPFNFSSFSSGTYNVIVGSNLTGASSLTFQVFVRNNNARHDTFNSQLVLLGSPNQVVNRTTVTQTGSVTEISMSYTFQRAGTYQLYVSVSDPNLNEVENTSVLTVAALQGLYSSLTPTSQQVTQSQSDNLLLNVTDNFGYLSSQADTEGPSDHYTYTILQTAPNGTVSTIASTTPAGLPYQGSYSISTGPLRQVGVYHYAAHVADADDGTNATATSSVSVGQGSAAQNSVDVLVQNAIIDVGENTIATADVVNQSLLAPFTYSWKFEGSDLQQSTGSVKIYGNQSDVGANPIAVMVTSHLGQQGTGAATITVNPNLTSSKITVSVPDSTISVGQTETVTAVVGGGAVPASYSWAINGNTIPQSGQSITFAGNSSDLGTDTLTVAVTDAAGETAQNSGMVTVVPAISTTTAPQSTGGCGCGGGGGGGGFTGGLPPQVTPPSTVTTTIAPTTTVAPSKTLASSNSITSTSSTGTPKSTTVTARSSGLTPASMATLLLIVIIALLAIILALMLLLGRKGEGDDGITTADETAAAAGAGAVGASAMGSDEEPTAEPEEAVAPVTTDDEEAPAEDGAAPAEEGSSEPAPETEEEPAEAPPVEDEAPAAATEAEQPKPAEDEEAPAAEEEAPPPAPKPKAMRKGATKAKPKARQKRPSPSDEEDE